MEKRSRSGANVKVSKAKGGGGEAKERKRETDNSNAFGLNDTVITIFDPFNNELNMKMNRANFLRFLGVFVQFVRLLQL